MKQTKFVMFALVSMMALPAFAEESKEAVLAPSTPEQTVVKPEQKTIKISGDKVARREKRLLKKRLHKEKLEKKGETKPAESKS